MAMTVMTVMSGRQQCCRRQGGLHALRRRKRSPIPPVRTRKLRHRQRLTHTPWGIRTQPPEAQPRAVLRPCVSTPGGAALPAPSSSLHWRKRQAGGAIRAENSQPVSERAKGNVRSGSFQRFQSERWKWLGSSAMKPSGGERHGRGRRGRAGGRGRKGSCWLPLREAGATCPIQLRPSPAAQAFCPRRTSPRSISKTCRRGSRNHLRP